MKLEWYSPPPGRYHWAREGRSRCGIVLSLEIPLGRGGESQVIVDPLLGDTTGEERGGVVVIHCFDVKE